MKIEHDKAKKGKTINNSDTRERHREKEGLGMEGRP